MQHDNSKNKTALEMAEYLPKDITPEPIKKSKKGKAKAKASCKTKQKAATGVIKPTKLIYASPASNRKMAWSQPKDVPTTGNSTSQASRNTAH